MRMIAVDYLPFTIVEDREFKSVLAAIDEKLLTWLPCRKTLEYRVREAADIQRDTLRTLIREEVVYFSVATDSWTSKKEDDYAAIEQHYVDSEWHLRTLCLGTAFELPNHKATTPKAAISA